MKKTYLIHCTSVAGHLLEYIHHLYVGAIDCTDSKFIFILPSEFHEKKGLFDWPESSNISIEILEGVDNSVDKYNIIKKSYKKARNLGNYVKKYNPTDVVLLDLISYIPFLPLFVRSGIRVRGIVYRVYLYEWKESKWKKKTEDIIKYLLFSHFRVFDKVFILNDATAPIYLNKLYNTSVFSYLPDPIASISYNPQSARDTYGISSDKTVYLHPGGMLPYKGTIEILKAMDGMSDDTLSKVTVIFAGRVTPSIKKSFFDLYTRIKNRAQLILIDGFLPFEELGDLFATCDYVLIPYKVKGQSSGIVGHAAYYKKPVVVAEGGIIGKTVRKWHLGSLIKEPSADCIKEFLMNPRKGMIDGDGYVKSHSVRNFYRIIYDRNSCD